MDRKKLAVVIALIAIAVSLVYLGIMLFRTFAAEDVASAQDPMLIESYAYLPLPLVAFVSCVLLLLLNVRPRKKKKN